MDEVPRELWPRADAQEWVRIARCDASAAAHVKPGALMVDMFNVQYNDARVFPWMTHPSTSHQTVFVPVWSSRPHSLDDILTDGDLAALEHFKPDDHKLARVEGTVLPCKLVQAGIVPNAKYALQMHEACLTAITRLRSDSPILPGPPYRHIWFVYAVAHDHADQPVAILPAVISYQRETRDGVLTPPMFSVGQRALPSSGRPVPHEVALGWFMDINGTPVPVADDHAQLATLMRTRCKWVALRDGRTHYGRTKLPTFVLIGKDVKSPVEPYLFRGEKGSFFVWELPAMQ